VIAGSQIAGLRGAIFAVPTLAVLRVLFDFFRRRLRVQEPTSGVPQRPLVRRNRGVLSGGAGKR
jgi:predicted PurR-regulated permease PerM